MNRLAAFMAQAILVLQLLPVFGAATSPTKAASYPLPTFEGHKLIVNDETTAGEVAAAGGHLIADYGTRRLFEVPSAGLAALSNRPIELRDDYFAVFLNSGAFDTRQARFALGQIHSETFAGKRLHLVQFIGPIRPEWREAVLATGVRLVNYVPQNAYLVHGESIAIAKLERLKQRNTFIQWAAPLLGIHKIHPSARILEEQSLAREGSEYEVQLVDDPTANAESLAVLADLSLTPLQIRPSIAGLTNVLAKLPSGSLEIVAAEPSVVSIFPHLPRRTQGERQDQIVAGNIAENGTPRPGYLTWLAGKGFSQAQFDASGLLVDIADSGIDNGTLHPGHFGLYRLGDTTQVSRLRYARLFGTPNGAISDFRCGDQNANSLTLSTIQGWDGHGTLSAHILAGFDDRSGFPHTDSTGHHYGLGVCPFVRFGSSVLFDPTQFTNPDYRKQLAAAYADGARISNNSWGNPSGSAYDQDAQTYDALVRNVGQAGESHPMIVVFVAGNGGPGPGTINSPGTAKNVITVGASESVESMSTANGGKQDDGSDGSGYPDALANDPDQVADFSGRGPCLDGRMKPDLVAPGTHITGGAPQDSPPPPADGLGSALPCFDASGISALPGAGGLENSNNFFPLGQEFYTVSTGTSQAAPAVSGAAALLWQQFVNRGLPPPSPAMVKGFLVNSTRYLAPANAADPLWSTAQGMGRLNLGTALDDSSRLLRDQLPEDTFTRSGQSWTYTGTAARWARPIRVTLAWTDAPGSTVGAAYNNDLDLVVTAGGRTYRGNSFSGGYSTANGPADFRNNLESVFLSPGIAGPITVTVTAANVAAAGVPNRDGIPTQDFALVIYNIAPAPPVVVHLDYQGETATVSFVSGTWTSYSLEHKDSLLDPAWQPNPDSVVGTGGLVSLTDHNPGGQNRFYRIVAR